MGQSIDQPDRGQPRHPRADQRNALANKEELEIAVPQRSPRVRNETPRGRGLRFYPNLLQARSQLALPTFDFQLSTVHFPSTVLKSHRTAYEHT
jgi:hypothetical protein